MKKKVPEKVSKDKEKEIDNLPKSSSKAKSKDKKDKKEKVEVEYVNFGVGYSIYKTTVPRKYLLRKPYQPADPNKITAFIPGTILDVKVSEGQEVKAGTILLILEAMKMKNRIVCPFDAIIKSLYVSKGDVVKKDQLLVELEAQL